jgi:hypothetical protein
VLLGLLYGQNIADLTQQGIATLFDAATLRLMAAVLLIMVLGELLKAIASMERLVRSLEALIQDSRLILPIVPALIGLLPMLGGAMFSAPLVEGIGTSLKLRPEQKTYINYWFRHIWEYVFPLYGSTSFPSIRAWCWPERCSASPCLRWCQPRLPSPWGPSPPEFFLACGRSTREIKKESQRVGQPAAGGVPASWPSASGPSFWSSS